MKSELEEYKIHRTITHNVNVRIYIEKWKILHIEKDFTIFVDYTESINKFAAPKNRHTAMWISYYTDK